MPSQKLVITCDNDGSELTCAGGYLSDEDSALVIYFCEKCGKFYISNNGEFIDSAWEVLEVADAEALQASLGKNINTDS